MSRMWKMVFFDTAKKPFETICPKCKCDLIFIDNGDCDSERAEKVKTHRHMTQRKTQTVHIIYLSLNALIAIQQIHLKFQQ